MKIFIDSGDIGEIKEAQSMGIIDGVTTNPSLLAKGGKPTKEAIARICEYDVDGPTLPEVVATIGDGILARRELAKIHKNVVIKVPLIKEGLKAVRIFTQEGIYTNVTPASQAGRRRSRREGRCSGDGRLRRAHRRHRRDGMEFPVQQIVTIYENYGFDTEVLTASVRGPVHFVQAALIGSHVATVPLMGHQAALKHPLTDAGLAQFLAEAIRN